MILKRRHLVFYMAIFAAFPSFAKTKRRVFFVSQDGDDSNDGLSESRPLRSLARVAVMRFFAGDTILLRRGDSFPGPLTINRVGPAAFIRVGAYGVGAKPKVTGWKSLSAAAWEIISPGLWRIAIGDPIGGNPSLVSGGGTTGGKNGVNIGCVKLEIFGQDTVIGAKRFDLGGLKSEGDFFSDEASFLYVRSTNNLSNKSCSVCVTINNNAVDPVSNLRLEGLSFEGFGGHGCRITKKTSDIIISSCDFIFIGGARLFGNTRYGNGIECWVDSFNIIIENCLFEQIYDAGFTMQGFPVTHPENGWRNISVIGNSFRYCQQMFEIWSRFSEKAKSGTCPPGSGFRNIEFSRNNCYGIGYGWGNIGREQKDNSCPILIYDTEAPVNDISFSDNTFEFFKGALIYSLSDTILPLGLKFLSNNVNFADGSAMIVANRKYAATQWSSFAQNLSEVKANTITFHKQQGVR